MHLYEIERKQLRTRSITSVNDAEQNRKAVRALSFPELLEFHDLLTSTLLIPVPPVAVRLRNCITMATNNGTFPFNSVGEYLDAGKSATSHLVLIPNFGMKSAWDLRRVIEDAIHHTDVAIGTLETNGSIPHKYPAQKNIDDIRALSFPELLEKCVTSER